MSSQKNLSFTHEAWAQVERETIAWWNHELQRPLVYLAVPNASVNVPWRYQSNFPLNISGDELIELYVDYLTSMRYYADAFPWMWVNFGPGIMAGFLGAQVHSVTSPSETVWFTPNETPVLNKFNLTYDSQNIWLKRVKEVTHALVSRFGSLLQVGHTDLGGNLDVLASFVTTQQLLMDLIEQPEEVMRLVNQITTLWLKYYDEFDAIIRPTCRGTSSWTPIWSPGKTYMLQCDFSYMISPRMFEKFVMPDLSTICDHLDHGFYHLDGKGEIPHLKYLLAIDRLKGIQWIPGDGQPPPDQWLDLLYQIRSGGKLCQVFVSPEGARHIVKNLGGKGFLLVINQVAAEFENPDVVNAFLNLLKDEDISQNKY
jgi:5-methyltetrahydrofolate--homocysteine methyltransferase